MNFIQPHRIIMFQSFLRKLMLSMGMSCRIYKSEGLVMGVLKLSEGVNLGMKIFIREKGKVMVKLNTGKQLWFLARSHGISHHLNNLHTQCQAPHKFKSGMFLAVGNFKSSWKYFRKSFKCYLHHFASCKLFHKNMFPFQACVLHKLLIPWLGIVKKVLKWLL